ncbi:hypothetical protein DFH27DRAFT_581505 [Peziza echinospora]|nr:hypothetical protein DFH27DRAFT_581505 [Peziza echinospora]
MSIPAHRPPRQSSAHSPPPLGVQQSAAWPRNQAGPQRKRARYNPTHDEGAEAWVADIKGQPRAIDQLASQDALLVNYLTAFVHGSEEAVALYAAERAKRNSALSKIRLLCARECIAIIYALLGYECYPPAATGLAPAGDGTIPPGHWCVTRGEFLNEYFRPAPPAKQNLRTKLLSLPPTSRSFGSLCAILGYPSRGRLNDEVHNVTLGEIEDLLEHIQRIGNEAAADELGWSAHAPSKALAQANVGTFARIVTDMIAPWVGPAPPKGLTAGVDFRLQVVAHWREQTGYQHALGDARGWAQGYLPAKKQELNRDILKDGVSQGIVADAGVVTALQEHVRTLDAHIEAQDAQLASQAQIIATQAQTIADQNIKIADQNIKIADQNIKIADQATQLTNLFTHFTAEIASIRSQPQPTTPGPNPATRKPLTPKHINK